MIILDKVTGESNCDVLISHSLPEATVNNPYHIRFDNEDGYIKNRSSDFAKSYKLTNRWIVASANIEARESDILTDYDDQSILPTFLFRIPKSGNGLCSRQFMSLNGLVA